MSEGKIVVDTNVVSYIMKGNDLGRAYALHLQGKLASVSFVTVGELYFGAEKGSWGEKRRKQLEGGLKNYVVIPYDNEIAKYYGKIVAERQRNGKPISCSDAWIAACAVRHHVPIITHNVKDFESILDLKVITEYQQLSDL